VATAFSRTLRSLEADRFRGTALVFAGVACLIGLWVYWATRSHVALYEVTENARLEIDNAVYPLQAPMGGRITSASLVIGQEVKEGDVLVELESDPQTLEVKEQQARLTTIDPNLKTLEAEAAAEEAARSQEQQASRAAIEESQLKLKELKPQIEYAQSEFQRYTTLVGMGLSSTRQLEKARADVEGLKLNEKTLASAAVKLEQEQRTRDSERAVRIDKLNEEIRRLEGDRKTMTAALTRLGNEVARRKIRSPVAGRIGEAAILRSGTVVAAGDKLAAIVPQGKLLIVAQFPPPSAFGRIRAGQQARMRLRGFPWAEFGTVRAQVERVADEVRDGTVRVELSVLDSPGLRAPLKHGMPGSVEIEVDEATPAALLMRTAGQLFSGTRDRYASPAEGR
jgi:membrane fusion protein (multidrug efflux system)